ncbi:MAG: DUF327 family protein [Brevinema sp.]
MKITPDTINKKQSLSTQLKKNTSKTSPSSFMEMIHESSGDESILETLFSEPDSVLSNISVLAEELDRLGAELSEKPLPENFNRYKKHIRLLLKGVGRNIEIKEITARVGFTRTKLFRTAQAIDQVLADLADKILCDEKNRMDILKLTGHLKGLILDLFA